MIMGQGVATIKVRKGLRVWTLQQWDILCRQIASPNTEEVRLASSILVSHSTYAFESCSVKI